MIDNPLIYADAASLAGSAYVILVGALIVVARAESCRSE
jgi:hypothetical protein